MPHYAKPIHPLRAGGQKPGRSVIRVRSIVLCAGVTVAAPVHAADAPEPPLLPENPAPTADDAHAVAERGSGLGGGAVGHVAEQKKEQDAFDSDARAPLNYKLSHVLSVGGNAEVKMKFEDNFDLDPNRSDYSAIFEPQAKLAALYQPAEDVELFGEVRFEYRGPLQDTGNDQREELSTDFREGYVLLRTCVRSHVTPALAGEPSG